MFGNGAYFCLHFLISNPGLKVSVHNRREDFGHSVVVEWQHGNEVEMAQKTLSHDLSTATRWPHSAEEKEIWITGLITMRNKKWVIENRCTWKPLNEETLKLKTRKPNNKETLK